MKKAAVTLTLAIGLITVGTTARLEAQSGTELFRLLPEGNMVAVIDLQRVTTSGLWATLTAQPKIKSVLDKMQSDIAEVGLSFSDIQTAAVVFPGMGFDSPTIAVTGGFDQAALLAALKTSQKFKLTSEKYNDAEIYTIESVPQAPAGEAAATPPIKHKRDITSFFFSDSKTVVVGSTTGVRASVDARSGARPSIAQNAKLSDALAQNASAAIRFAISVTPSMAGKLGSSSLPIPDFSSINLIFGAIDLGSGAELSATLRNETAEQAKSMAERLSNLLNHARGLLTAATDPKLSAAAEALKSVSIVGQDVDVKITASVPAELLVQLLK